MLRPRPYLSWSQFNRYNSSPEQYKKLYIFGEGGFTNRGMEYGKKMADALENDKCTGDIVLDYVMNLLPKSGKMEVELRGEVMGVPIYGKMDSASNDLSFVDEYKTGAVGSWNKNKANASAEKGQICFYATGIYFKTKKIPKTRLTFVPTIKNDLGQVEATGEIITFQTEVKLKDILVMATKMKKVWKGIGEMCEEELL